MSKKGKAATYRSDGQAQEQEGKSVVITNFTTSFTDSQATKIQLDSLEQFWRDAALGSDERMQFAIEFINMPIVALYCPAGQQQGGDGAR